MRIDLTKKNWQLYGWRPNYWHNRRQVQGIAQWRPEFGPFDAVVPGSAQTALRKARVLPDWNKGTGSLLCEWVEHRQWEFRTMLSAIKAAPGEPITLHCDGLDYSGWIAIDTQTVGTFSGALIRHRFDLTPYLIDGKPHVLSILFDLPPEEQGQSGTTSKSRYFKPRYSYSWDWCPRFVPIGIWDKLWLEVGRPACEVMKVLATLTEDLHTGNVQVFVDRAVEGEVVRATLRRGRTQVASVEHTLAPGAQTITLNEIPVEPWFCNGLGKPVLYDLTLEADEPLYRKQIGFKRVEWLPADGAPEDARPMICQLNSQRIFLQGVNWTPISMDYHHVPEAEYEKRIRLYKEMGVNVLRVWGGAYLEREVFYDLCDRAGILVWQEFPLSSSALESYAPDDPAAVADLERIARDYIQRRADHVSHLLWCGGNELQTRHNQKGQEFPLTESHPALSAMKRIVEADDPGTRFLPTSPSGPVFYAQPNAVGTGTRLHVHVHGPWNHFGPIEAAEEYWRKDDANFRSETGMPGCQSVAMIKKYAGELNPWPPTRDNPLWMHSSLWWLQWDQFAKDVKRMKPAEALKRFVKLSQDLQAYILSLAAASCKRRFLSCGGFIIWMGHDAFPCCANTSIIDFEGNPKPAYRAVQTVFRTLPESLAYNPAHSKRARRKETRRGKRSKAKTR